jgi:hypothetical protein
VTLTSMKSGKCAYWSLVYHQLSLMVCLYFEFHQPAITVSGQSELLYLLDSTRHGRYSLQKS